MLALTWKNEIRLHEVPSGILMRTINTDPLLPSYLAISPDGSALAYAHDEGIVVLSLESDEGTMTFDVQEISGIAFHGTSIMVMCYRKLVKCDMTNNETTTIRLQKGIEPVALSPNGDRVITTNNKNRLFLMDLIGEGTIAEYPVSAVAVDAEFSKDGQTIAIMAACNSLILLSPKGEFMGIKIVSGGNCYDFHISDDSREVIVYNSELLRFLNTETLQYDNAITRLENEDNESTEIFRSIEGYVIFVRYKDIRILDADRNIVATIQNLEDEDDYEYDEVHSAFWEPMTVLM
jgi:WD40 repeat protein